MLRSHSSGTAPFGGSGHIHSTGPKLMSHSSSGPLVSTAVVSDDYSELLISKLIAIKVGAASLLPLNHRGLLCPPKREFVMY